MHHDYGTMVCNKTTQADIQPVLRQSDCQKNTNE